MNQPYTDRPKIAAVPAVPRQLLLLQQAAQQQQSALEHQAELGKSQMEHRLPPAFRRGKG